MKDNKRNLLSLVFIIAVVATVLSFSGSLAGSYAAINDSSDNVYFIEQYAAVGDSLTVKYDGSETDLKYKWFVDGQEIASGEGEEAEPIGNQLEIKAEHYQKNISVEVWSADKKLGEASMFCSKLPVIYIDTEGGAEIASKDDYLNAQMHVQGNELYNSGNSTLYTGATEIKGRGNSTWKLFPKKPYRLKLDKKTDLLGLGKSKHWVLLANYIDETGMRNMLAGAVAKQMDVDAMDGTWVEVVVNGENLGMYMLCEHVRLAEDRVNVFDWESVAEDIAEAIAEANGYSEDEMDALTDFMAEEDMSWISTGEVTFNGETYKTKDYYEELPESFSGGYLLEMDLGYDEVSKFTTDNGAPIMFKSPEFISTDETAMNAVKSYVQTFEDAVYSQDFCTDADGKVVSYTELCDMDSLTGFWLTSELLINEIGYKSTYFQKDIDQPLEFGPVWDFDYSSGAVTPYGSQNPTDWTSDNKVADTGGDKWWFDKLMKDPYFAVKVRETYLKQEDYLKSVIAEDGVLAEWYDYIKESGEYNYQLWKYADGFQADYDVLSSWLRDRIYWIDEQFATNESAMASMDIAFSDKVELKLQGDQVVSGGDKAYIAQAGNGDMDLAVEVGDGEYPQLNLYINSRYIGTADIVEGKANIVVKEEQLTEDVGEDNVITVWLKDSKGELVEQQFLTVKLQSDKNLCNVVFNSEIGGTYSIKAVVGEKVYIEEPLHQDEHHLFGGWSDGVNTYAAGKWVTVNEDMELNAVWTQCSDGTSVHDFASTDDGFTCIRTGCDVVKKHDGDYINIRTCTLTCSDRYSNYYTGKELKPAITVSDGDKLLTEGKDYTIDFRNTVDVGYAIYTIKGIKEAGYTGEVTLSYRILERSISSATITVSPVRLLQNGIAEPEVKLTYNGATLVEGTDYDLTYANNTKAGTGSVTIVGKGNFTGTVTKNFNVVAQTKTMSKCTFGINSAYAYTGSAVKPAVTVKDGTTKLVAGENYTITYSNNVKCGTATAKITGIAKNGYTGTKTLTYKIQPGRATVKVANVKYNVQKVTWTNVPGATKYHVYRSTNNKTYKLVKTISAKYSRVYTSSGLEVGRTYYYKVKAARVQSAAGKSTTYTGSASTAASSKTVLYKSTITSVKNSAAKTATIKWAGINGAQGYKVYRSTKQNSSYKLIATVKNSKQYVNKSLKKGTTYYYKVKAYCVVNGKTVYGAASSAAAVKISK